MNIGQTIDDARKRVNLSKAEFAKKCGLKSSEAIRLIVQNRRIPGVSTLEKIVKAGKIPQEQAIQLREECMIARAVRTGFDVHEVSGKVWDRFSQALEEEGVDEDVDLGYLRDVFMESMTRYLAIETGG